MNTKLLMTVAIVFFAAWKKASDSFLLFCALFAAGLWICEIIYQVEDSQSVMDGEPR